MERRETPQDRYEKNNIKRFTLKLNINYDEDLISKLQSVDNVNGYLKDLIRRDTRKGRHK